jgi:hypothetical protein
MANVTAEQFLHDDAAFAMTVLVQKHIEYFTEQQLESIFRADSHR